jgi:hypothetical protein
MAMARVVSALGAHIENLKEEVARQLTVDCEIPLLRVRPRVAIQWPILIGR